MKTMKIFFALSLAMILFAFNSNNVNAGNNKPNGPIQYQVIVHVDPNFFFPYQMTVFISDANGRVIAHPQVYVRGTAIYNFAEPGPQTGKRIAQITLYPLIGDITLNVLPDVKTGPFEVGKIYTFNLYLKSPKPTDPIGAIQ